MSRIYISSTFEDLKTTGSRCITSCATSATTSSPWKTTWPRIGDRSPTASADISSCDLYIGLFAWRYGYVPDDPNPRRLSITELEYRHAVGRVRNVSPSWWTSTSSGPPLQDSHTGDGEGGRLIRHLRDELSTESKWPSSAPSRRPRVSRWRGSREVGAESQSRASATKASKLTLKQLTSDREDRRKQADRTGASARNQRRHLQRSDGHRRKLRRQLLHRAGRRLKDLTRQARTERPSRARSLPEAGFSTRQVAITTGGDWGRRAVIHAAVIDLDNDDYPRQRRFESDPTKP